MNRTATLLALSLIFAIFYSGCAYAQQPGLSATVTALQGVVQAYAGADQGPKQLQKGGAVEPWDMVSTDAKSRLILQWQNGLLGAIGEFSSMVLSTEDMEGRSTPSIQIINGIFRFAGPETSTGGMPAYSVTTPLAAIYPVASDRPADFTVEVHDPKTTVVSVMSGQVRVRKPTGEDKIVQSCHSFFLEEGKAGFDPFPLSAANFKRLVEDTTIPGTFAADATACGATTEAIPRGPEYAFPADYYVEDWDDIDFYPYEFRVMPPPYAGGAYILVIPGIGQWFIELPYSVDPAFVKIYVQQVFLDHYIGFCHDHIGRWRHRQHELAGMISLARMTGNTAMLMQAQQQLNDLNLRTHWATKRVRGLENRVAALGEEHRKFAGKLPAGVDLRNVIATSLNAPKNSGVSRKFQDRLKSDADVQNRLASLASQEIGDLNRKIAAQPDPEKRLALRQQLSGIRNDLASGKLLIPSKDKQVGSLVKELGKERDPGKRSQIEDRVLKQLKKVGEGPQAADLISQQKLTSMKQDLAKFPNPQGRQVMEQQLTALQQTVEKRKETEAVAEQTSKQMEKLSTQAATERNPDRRNQILNQLNELSRSVPGALPGRGQFLPQPSAGIQPSVEPQQQILQKKLEEQKKQSELQQQQLRQQQLEQQKQSDLKKQEKLQQQQLQRQQAVEQQKQEQELKKQQLRQQQLEQQKQSDLKKQEKLQQQQLQRQQAVEQQKQEQELKKQQLRQQQLEQQKQSELKNQEKLQQQQLQRQQAVEQQKQQQEVQKQLRQQQLQRQQGIEQQKQQQLQQQQMRQFQQEQPKQLEMKRQPQGQQPSLQMQTPAQPQSRQQAAPQTGQPQIPKGKGQLPPGFPGQ